MDERRNMGHLPYLPAVAQGDVAVLESKEATYKGSWKAAGGRSAWFMFRRNMDRLLNMCAHVPFELPIERIMRAIERGEDGLKLSNSEVEQMRKCLRSEDIFALIEAAPGGEDGTVLACLRDLRRYALLVEAEMVSRGIVSVEGAPDTSALGTGRAPSKPPLQKLPLGWKKTENPRGPLDTPESELLSTDFSALEARLFGAEVPDSSGNYLEALVRAVTTPEEFSASLAQAQKLVADAEAAGGEVDLYGVVAEATGRTRSGVKTIGFGAMYGLEITPDKVAEIAPKRDEIQRRTLEKVLSLVYPEWPDPALAYSVGYAIHEMPVACVFAQAGMLSGEEPERIRAAYARRLLDVDGMEKIADEDLLPGLDSMEDAIEHAVNFEGLDARLSCPDHVIAALLAPLVIQFLMGRSSVQLFEAGWRPSKDGKGTLVPPPSWRESEGPGTPEEGGHHAVREESSISQDYDELRRELFIALQNEVSHASALVGVPGCSRMRRAVFFRAPDSEIWLILEGSAGPLGSLSGSRFNCWQRGSVRQIPDDSPPAPVDMSPSRPTPAAGVETVG